MNDGDNPECSDTDNLPRDNGITETVQEIVSDSEMNQTNIYCQHCPSLILTALKGRILEKEVRIKLSELILLNSAEILK